MKTLTVIFAICLNLSFQADAVDYYPDMRAPAQTSRYRQYAPESGMSDDYIIERLQRIIQQEERNRLMENIQQGNDDFTFDNSKPAELLDAPPPPGYRYYETPLSEEEESQVAKKSKDKTTSTAAPTTTTTTTAPTEQLTSLDSPVSRIRVDTADGLEDIYFIAAVAGCSAAGVIIIILIGFLWYKWHATYKAAADVEYPAYGVTGPNKEISPTGDRRLAQSAQMYHYQHQKQQILALENSPQMMGGPNGSLSEPDSEDDNEEGDYTVYECPGPAPIGEMEVRNPLFLDDPTPATPANASNKK